jgi:Arylsulfotransferase (ASST)
MFEAGDLVLSSRTQHLVMVVDKTAATVKWWQIGPWLRQHDPEFKPGTLVIFNNNIHERTPTDPRTGPWRSTILEVDPATREQRVLFGGQPGQELLTVIRGKVDLTPRGGLLITAMDAALAPQTA